MPSTPSQKSIDVCRSAPTIVMWWTPWLWSLRIALVLHEFRFVLAAPQAPPRHELHTCLHDQYVAQSLADRLREGGIGRPALGELDAHWKRRLLLHALRARLDEDVTAHVGSEPAHHLAHGGGEDVDPADDEHV